MSMRVYMALRKKSRKSRKSWRTIAPYYDFCTPTFAIHSNFAFKSWSNFLTVLAL